MFGRTPRSVGVDVTDGERRVAQGHSNVDARCPAHDDLMSFVTEGAHIAAGIHEAGAAAGFLQRLDREIDSEALGNATEIDRDGRAAADAAVIRDFYIAEATGRRRSAGIEDAFGGLMHATCESQHA